MSRVWPAQAQTSCYQPPEPCCPEPDPCFQAPPGCQEDIGDCCPDECDDECGQEEDDCECEEEEISEKKRSFQEDPAPVVVVAVELETKKGFCQCDCVAILILITLILAILILSLAVWYYVQDSYWNGIVRTDNPFPVIQDDEFIGGKYLWLYQDVHPVGQSARLHLLRDNRWLELFHIIFFALYIILTVVQLILYMTRGREDHTKIILVYYAIVGGLAIIVALFPMVSWNGMAAEYQGAAYSLRQFSYIIKKEPGRAAEHFANAATAKDMLTLASICEFCYESGRRGLTFEEDDKRHLYIFKREYTYKELQSFGFCTHNKFKILNTFLSFLFAFICCIIPCLFCLAAGALFGAKMRKSSSVPPPPPSPQHTPGQPLMAMSEPPPGQQTLAPRTSQTHHHEHHHHHHHGERKKLSGEGLMEELKKFTGYVEGGSDEEANF